MLLKTALILGIILFGNIVSAQDLLPSSRWSHSYKEVDGSFSYYLDKQFISKKDSIITFWMKMETNKSENWKGTTYNNVNYVQAWTIDCQNNLYRLGRLLAYASDGNLIYDTGTLFKSSEWKRAMYNTSIFWVIHDACIRYSLYN